MTIDDASAFLGRFRMDGWRCSKGPAARAGPSLVHAEINGKRASARWDLHDLIVSICSIIAIRTVCARSKSIHITEAIIPR